MYTLIQDFHTENISRHIMSVGVIVVEGYTSYVKVDTCEHFGLVDESSLNKGEDIDQGENNYRRDRCVIILFETIIVMRNTIRGIRLSRVNNL